MLSPTNRSSSKKRPRKFAVYPSSSSDLPYPNYLLHCRLHYNDWGEKLVADPSHVMGQRNCLLDLRPWSGCSAIVDQLSKEGFQVEKVVLSGHSECDDLLVEKVAQRWLKSLRSLSLSSCPLLSNPGLDQLYTMTNLLSLDLSNNFFVTDSFLTRLAQSLRLLQHLDISQCINVSDGGVITIANTISPRLLTFHCSDNPKVTFKGANELLMRAEQLIDLDFSNCPRLEFIGIVIETDNRIQQYLGRRLQKLKLNNCVRLSRVAMKYITTALPDLQHFSGGNILSVDNEVLYDLLEGCKNLVELQLNGCTGLTERALEIVKTHLSRLKTLSLGHIFHVDTSDALSNHVVRVDIKYDLIDILGECERLEVLDLSNHLYLVDQHLLRRGQPSSIRNHTITEIYLANCPQLTSVGFMLIGRYCPLVQTLDLTGSLHLTDTGMQGLATQCQQLRKLVLNNCHHLTDQSVQTVCIHIQQLEELYLSYDEIAFYQHLDKSRRPHSNTTSALTSEALTFSPQSGRQYSDNIWPAVLKHGKCLQVLVVSNQLDLKLGGSFLSKAYHLMATHTHANTHTTLKKTASSASTASFQSVNSTSSMPQAGLLLGHYSLTYLDLRGCSNVDGQNAISFLPLFHRLQTLALPNHLSANKTLLSQKYFVRHFSRLPYVEDYDKDNLTKQIDAIQKAMEVNVDAKKGLVAKNNKNFLAANKCIPLFLLRPHPLYERWFYRDCLVRRRLLEQRAVRVILQAYWTFRIWKKFKHILMGRRILQAYRRHKIELKRQLALKNFIEKRSVRVIERYYFKYRIVYRRSAVRIQRKFRSFRKIMRQWHLRQQTKKIVLIQKMMRGYLARTSQRHIIAQLYLKLPPFWKQIANLPAPFAKQQIRERLNKARYYTKKTEMYEVDQLQTTTQDILFHITHKEADDDTDVVVTGDKKKKQKKRKLAAQLEEVIPQAFDLSPYVSLSDGRKLCFYNSSISLFNNTFLRETRNTVMETLSVSQMRFLSGNFTNSVDALRQKHVTSAEELSVHLPMHIYNYTYWPISRKPPYRSAYSANSVGTGNRTVVPDDDIYNPLINNFEFVLNKKLVLYCEKCNRRLRLIHCKVCNRGYCFHCAYYGHSSLLTKFHEMQYVEPRVYKVHTVSPSLIYYINNSHVMLYGISYIYKYLSSQAEVKRLQKEKELMRNFEKEQERLRLIFLQSQEKYKTEYNKANQIILLYRAFRAKKLVQEKRRQKQIEDYNSTINKAMKGILKCQVLIRRFLTRMWWYKRGVVYHTVQKYYYTVTIGNTKKSGSMSDLFADRLLGRDGGGGGKLVRKKSKGVKKEEVYTKKIFHTYRKMNRSVKAPISRVDLMQRCQVELTRRAFYLRNVVFWDLEQQFIVARQFVETNIDYWTAEFHKTTPKIDNLRKERESLFNAYKEVQKEKNMANLSATSEAVIQLNNKHIKAAQMKFESMQSRLEIMENIQWWIQQVLRMLYRKEKILTVRFEDLVKRMHFVSVEFFLLNRILSFTRKRSAAAGSKHKQAVDNSSSQAKAKAIDNNVDWLVHYEEALLQQIILLDSQQESLLREESIRTEKDHQEMNIFANLLTELINSQQVNIQIFSERVSLEKQLLFLENGSDEGIRSNEQLILLKNKQKILTTHSIDSLKGKLQEMLDAFDQHNISLYAFPNDSPDLAIDQLPKIEIVLLEPYEGGRHLLVQTFVLIYLLQPWIVSQCVDDIRYEERINSKTVRYHAYQEEYKVKQGSIRERNDEIIRLMEENKQLEALVIAHLDPIPDEDDGEKILRENNLLLYQQRLHAKQLELEISRKMLSEEESALRPLIQNMAEVNKEIAEVKKQLAQRVAARSAAIDKFLSTEKDLVAGDLSDLHNLQVNLEDQQAVLMQRKEVLQQSLAVYENMEKEGRKNEVSYLHLPAFVKLCPGALELQALYHQIRPALYCPSATVVKTLLHYQLETVVSKLAYLETLHDLLLQEANFLSDFAAQLPLYRSHVDSFISQLQVTRRLKALDLELTIRKSNLEAFRASRLQALQAAKQAQLEAEMEEQRKREEKLRNRKSPLKKAIKGTIQKKRQLERAIEELLQPSHELDEEEKRMVKNLRERNKEGAGSRPECIKDIYITYTSMDYAQFLKQNDHLKSKGLPYYRPMERTLGGQIYLWTQISYDDTSFITDIYLSHKQEDSEYHLDMTAKNAYDEVIKHETSDLQIYLKRDKHKARAMKALHLAYTESEENDFVIRKYVKVEPNLGECLPDLFPSFLSHYC
eukprot:scaffold1446_cov175-Ochromonas_danica.AAC.11